MWGAAVGSRVECNDECLLVERTLIAAKVVTMLQNETRYLKGCFVRTLKTGCNPWYFPYCCLLFGCTYGLRVPASCVLHV